MRAGPAAMRQLRYGFGGLWLASISCCSARGPTDAGRFLRESNISTALAVPFNGDKRRSILEQLRRALAHVSEDLEGTLHMEFGVREGDSLRFLSNLTGSRSPWHGFDSFVGLPEGAFGSWHKGTFDMKGRMPIVPDHVQLHAGWFNETLPSFLDAQRAVDASCRVGFMNMDADLYVSTIAVFDAVFSRCMHRRGTVISFDELFGTAAILEHEWRALKEAQNKYGITFHFISYAVTTSSFVRAAIQLDSCGQACESECDTRNARPNTKRNKGKE